MNIGQKVLFELKKEISETEYERYIKKLLYDTRHSRSNVVYFNAPNMLVAKWVKTKYADKLAHLFELQNQIKPEVVINVGKNTPAKKAAPKQAVEKSASKSTYLNPSLTFESFIVGDSNQFAYTTAKSVAEKPGKQYNPLFIYGGVGLGKTHLMQAIGNYVKEKMPEKTVVYTTTESFMNELIEALRKDTIAEFREKYRTVDVLLVDDIQFISGKDRTQIEFFHTFNALYDAGKQIVLTSDRPPKDIPTLTDRLRNRFEWGLIADIQPPDFETRIAILRRKAEVEKIEVDDNVLKLIATIIKSNIRQLEGALIKLKAKAILENRPIDEELVRSMFGIGNSVKVENPSRSDISIDEIKQVVCEMFGITLEQIDSSTRKKQIALARQIAMYLSRKFGNFSFPKIAAAFHRNDHTTVMHAVTKIEELRNENEEINHIILELEKRLTLLVGEVKVED